MKSSMLLLLSVSFLSLLNQSLFSAAQCEPLVGHVEENDLVDNTIENPAGIIKFSSDADVRVSKSNIVTLLCGDILIDAKETYVVRIGETRVLVRPNSTCLISYRDQTVKIRNLGDRQLKSDFVIVSDKWYELAVGHEFVFAPEQEMISNSVVDDKTRRRNLETYEISDSGSILRCEYSIVSVIAKIELLRTLQKSSLALDRKLLSKTLKTAACLDLVTSWHGPYLPVTAAE